MSNEFIFIDLETTGLVPDKGYILELGMAVYSKKLEPVSKFHSLVATPESMNFIKSQAWRDTSFAYAMHQKSGLNSELLRLDESAYVPGGSCHIDHVFETAQEWASDWGTLDGFLVKEPLCGNSLGFDRSWLAHHIPWFNDSFSYRNIDCSGMFEYIKKVDPELAQKVESSRMQKGGHRVLGDIQDSVNLLKAMKYNGAIL